MQKMKPAISIYVGLEDYSLEDNINYLRLAKAAGIEIVFTSAHIPESVNASLELEKILSEIDNLGMKLIIDVSKDMMATFNIPKSIYALRLDYGFSVEEIVKMSNECSYFIELNAATLTSDYLNRLVASGLNPTKVRASYNFYPKRYTGISIDDVIFKNKEYKRLGLTIMAFIPANFKKRPPLYEGLPTVENHRFAPRDIVLAELAIAGVDEVGFGDAYASSEELSDLANYDYEYAKIPVELLSDVTDAEKEMIFKNHRSRTDQSPYMVRSSVRTDKAIEPHHNDPVQTMDVTVDNKLYLRYAGEVGIALMPMEASLRCNVVGRIPNCAHKLVEILPPGSKFKLIEK